MRTPFLWMLPVVAEIDETLYRDMSCSQTWSFAAEICLRLVGSPAYWLLIANAQHNSISRASNHQRAQQIRDGSMMRDVRDVDEIYWENHLFGGEVLANLANDLKSFVDPMFIPKLETGRGKSQSKLTSNLGLANPYLFPLGRQRRRLLVR
jgi:hypothetical protein